MGHTVEGSKVKRLRSLGELKVRLLQAGKACVRKPKCQRRQ
jgi:hypothetical protein